MMLAQKTSAIAISVIYLLNILITSLASFTISLFNTNNAITLAVIYFALLLFSLLIYWTMVHRRSLG